MQAIATVKYCWLESGVRHRAKIYVLDKKTAYGLLRIGDEKIYSSAQLVFSNMQTETGIRYLRKDELLVELTLCQGVRFLKLHQKYPEISFSQYSRSSQDLKDFIDEEPEFFPFYESIFNRSYHFRRLQPMSIDFVKARAFYAIISLTKEKESGSEEYLKYLISLAHGRPVCDAAIQSALEAQGLIKQVGGVWIFTSTQMQRYFFRFTRIGVTEYLSNQLSQFNEILRRSVKEASIYSIHDRTLKCKKLV